MSPRPGSFLMAQGWSCGSLVVLALACRAPAPEPPTVMIGGMDYAFESPTELRPGLTRFQFANRGRVPHELAMGELHEGVSADSVLAYADAGNDPGDLARVVGILIANPGDTALGTLTADLVPGRTYIMICGFKDADSLPPHIAMGMQSSFVVAER